MNWIETMSNAISFIEENLTDDIAIENVAKHVCVSEFYFQKAFAILCGFTVSEYLRQRRLALAGSELMSTDNKIIDIAVKYGYDSPDSFTKAFTRFHGTTPTAVRKNGALIKSFAPLKLIFTLEGGYIMDYKIIEKQAFTIAGVSKVFKPDDAPVEIPKLWQESSASVCGMFGISIAQSEDSKEFEYWIADVYDPTKNIPDGIKTTTIPALTWAVFPCKGTMPEAMQTVQRKIFTEWLPNCKDYEVAEFYNVELYTDPQKYTAGIADNDYYAEVWIPVRKK